MFLIEVLVPLALQRFCPILPTLQILDPRKVCIQAADRPPCISGTGPDMNLAMKQKNDPRSWFSLPAMDECNLIHLSDFKCQRGAYPGCG